MDNEPEVLTVLLARSERNRLQFESHEAAAMEKGMMKCLPEANLNYPADLAEN